MMRCEICGHEQESGRVCEVCGMMLTRILVEAAELESPVEVQCACGHTQVGGRFCDACGMALDPPPPEAPPVEIRCACGHTQQGGRFCDACGMALDIPRETRPTPIPPERPTDVRCACGHVQATGRFCDACGMALDIPRPRPAEAAPQASGICPQCGQASDNLVCRACGVRVRSA